MIRLTRLYRALGVAIVVAGLAGSTYAQRQGGTGGATTTPTSPGGGATTPTAPTPGRTTTPQPSQQPFPNPMETRGPIFLSGRVMLDSGTPPPEPVTIERVCNGFPRAEAYTDSKGRFSFQLGANNNGVLQDASMGSDRGLGGFGGLGGASSSSNMGMNPTGGVSERELMGCEIRASLAGYRSDMINLSGRRQMDNPELGTIVLHRIAGVEGVSISASSLNAPKDAKKAYDKGHELLKKQKIADARKELEKAVEIYPGYAVAWFDLGLAREGQNDIEGARAAYDKALAADAKFLKPYPQLLGIAVKQQNWEQTADISAKLVKLDPVDFPTAHYYNAVSNYFLKNFDAAEKSIRETQRLDTRNRLPKSNQLLGAILIEKRDYSGAAEQIRKYLSALPADSPETENVRKQLDELEKVSGGPKPAAEP